MKHDKITPYQSGKDKQQQVAEMFNNIANRYDLLNSVLSLGIHKGWRKKSVRMLERSRPKRILDVATGTGDFAIACAELKPEQVTGIDISEGMLGVGREKIAKLGLGSLIRLEHGNAETYNAQEGSYDAIVVGFGVRNFQNLGAGLRNLHRLLAPGGVLLVLEFSYPTNFLLRRLYDFYLGYLTPAAGRLFSSDRRAYSYLAESVKAFPNNEGFVKVMEDCGFSSCSFKPLSGGIAAVYTGKK